MWAEKERQFMINIGHQANHMLVAEILPLFSAEIITVVIPSDLTVADEKFDYILHLSLAKIDEKDIQRRKSSFAPRWLLTRIQP